MVAVWLALAHGVHPHHEASIAWGESLDPQSEFYFCRLSQLSLLRLLTNASAMGAELVTQVEAWRIYDLSFANDRTFFAEEPKQLEELLRDKTMKHQGSTKGWSDAYFAAFAESSGLRLVTFDKALAAKTKGTILLRSA